MRHFAQRLRLSTWATLALIGITALAAGLRLFWIDRLPPGLSYDEAWNDRQALRVVQGRAHPVYFVDEWGDVEEPLHIYLIATLFALTGPQAIGGRLVSAFLGTLTVPLLFFATREMLRGLHADPLPPLTLLAEQGEKTPNSDTIALLAAFVLATLYWHVHYTRLGMEPPTVPALATLTFWLLWRAFNRGRWLDHGLAGGTLGLSLYTHPSARFLPIIIALFGIWRWAGPVSNLKYQISKAQDGRALIRGEIPRFCLLVVCAIIVFAPLGLFFAQNPNLFFYRAGQASVVTFGGELGQTLVNNALKVMGGLVWRGDTNLRLNLPGRPGLDIVQLLLLVFGVAYALGHKQRRVLMFPLLWAGILLLPSVFSDAAPHFGRMLGATPALAILIALGIAQVSNIKYQIGDWTPEGREVRGWKSKAGEQRSEIHNTEHGTRNTEYGIGRVARIGFVLVTAAALAYSTVKTMRDYFVTWAHEPGLYTAFDVGLRQSAEYLASLPRDELISLSPTDRDLPVFRFTFRDDVSRLKTFNGRRCVVYPARPERDWTRIAIVAEETHSLDTLRRIFPSGQVTRKFFDAGTPYAIAYRIKAGDQAQTPLEEQAVFDDRIVLVHFQTPGDLQISPGDTLPVTLSWTSRVALDVSYTIFVHLSTSPDSPPVAQEDAQPCDNSYPTTWWSPGEIVEENRRIVIPDSVPPGRYVLTTGIYDLATGKRLPVRSPGMSPGDQFILGTVTVER